jgi:hypothetical protein
MSNVLDYLDIKSSSTTKDQQTNYTPQIKLNTNVYA